MKGRKLCLLFAFVLLFAAAGLTGCHVYTEKGDKTLPELNIYVVMSSSEASWNRIGAKVSEITAKKLGCTVKFHGIELNTYWDSLRQSYLNGDPIDVCAIFEQEALMALINRQWLLPLEDYMVPYENKIKELITDECWEMTRLRGHLYAITSNLSQSRSLGIVMRRDILDALEIDAADIRDMSDIHEVLTHVKAAYPDIAPLGAHYGQVLPYLGIDPLGNGFGVLLSPETDTLEVENLYASELYADYCRQMHQWYKEGLIMEKAYVSDQSYSQLMSENEIFACFVSAGNGLNNVRMLRKNIPMVEISIGKKMVFTDCNNLFWGISASSAYPELAAGFISMLYTDEDIIKLCAWGIEGEDYTYDDMGRLVWLEGQGDDLWQSIAWSWPNAKALERYYSSENTITRVEADKNIYVSPARGFVFDSETVADEVALCEAVVEKYDNALISGFLDPKTDIRLFLNDLSEAGIDEIIKEKKRQLDAWK